jgi:hypothetical protein
MMPMYERTVTHPARAGRDVCRSIRRATDCIREKTQRNAEKVVAMGRNRVPLPLDGVPSGKILLRMRSVTTRLRTMFVRTGVMQTNTI